MVKDVSITHPEQLELGTRYHVWYIQPRKGRKDEQKSFTDYFRGLVFESGCCFARWHLESELDWKRITAIQIAGTGE